MCERSWPQPLWYLQRELHRSTSELKRFIYETGRTQAIIQTDDEASIKAVAKNLIRELGGLSFRKAPTGSSQSQGSIERFHQTLASQLRVLRYALAEKLQLSVTELQVQHPIVPWMVKHSVWLLNRYLLHDDGLTACQRRFKHQKAIGISEFGEHILFKMHGKHDSAKAYSSFSFGMWLGRDPD